TIFEQTPDMWSRASITILEGLADTLQAQRKYKEALTLYERSQAIQKKAGYNRFESDSLRGQGQVYLVLGAPEKAVALLERALSLDEAKPSGPSRLANVQFDLARALRAAGRDLTRARSLAEKARQAYAAAGERKQEELAMVDAWLAGKQRPE